MDEYELADCPFCGGPGQLKDEPKPHRHGWVGCPICKIYKQWSFSPIEAIKKWNSRVLIFVEPAVYDVEEVHENCTVQIWRNSETGEESVGWFEND